MENFYEQIEAYLLGELAEPALTAFEQALRTDPALAEAVAQHREALARLEALRLRQKVKSALSSPQTLHKRNRGLIPQQYYWGMAAALALLAAAVWFFTRSADASPGMAENPVPDKPVATPPAPAPTSPAPVSPQSKAPNRSLALARAFQLPLNQSFMRSEAAQTEKSLVEKATEAYLQKNYALVTKLLADTGIADEEGVFLRANAYFQLGQFATAARDFGSLKNSFQFRHEARWNVMLCKLALGQVAEAQSLLSGMAAEADFPFHGKAQVLLKRL